MNWKGREERRSWTNSIYYPDTSVEELRKPIVGVPAATRTQIPVNQKRYLLGHLAHIIILELKKIFGKKSSVLYVELRVTSSLFCSNLVFIYLWFI
jgi:hypothetical protein